MSNGYITIKADVAIGGFRGDFGIKVTKIDMSETQTWSPTYSFLETGSNQLAKRTLAAGTYILKGELINQQPAMSIYYSLYSNLGYEFSKGIINGQYRIGPGVTGPNPFEVSFTLNEEQEVVLIMNSAYYVSPNNLKIDLIE